MRCGSPRGHFVFEFNKNKYRETFKAHGKPADKQLNLSFLTEQFKEWQANVSSANPTMTIEDPADQDRLLASQLKTAQLVANVWSASLHAQVTCQFDDRAPVEAQWNNKVGDPFALAQQVKLPKTYWTIAGRSIHLWTCPVPAELAPGVHKVTVRVKDAGGKSFIETKVFEVVKTKQ